MDEALSVVGKRLPRVDGIAKATGEAKFAADMKLRGMLIGKILVSPHAHAKVLRIDTSLAENLPGVKAVIWRKDAPRILWGTHSPPNCVWDQYTFDYRVRYKGEPVAAVAATSEEIAEEALNLIKVEYKVLPAVFDVEEAMKQNAPQLHADIDGVENNTARIILGEQGDVETGFEKADYTFEDRYTTSRQCTCPIENHNCICSFDRSGKLTVWAPTQTPFFTRGTLAKLMDMPVSKVRYIVPHVGAGFGGKCEPLVEPFCALLAKKAGRPVRIEYTREEEFYGTKSRHPCIINLKTGVKKDGSITARQIKAIYDTGAYSSHGPTVMPYGIGMAVSLYKCPNIKYEGYAVYTNKVVAGAYRGYGNPQVTFAVESQNASISEKIEMDPKEFRLKNHIQVGDTSAIGWKVISCGLDECIQKGSEKIGWERRAKEPDMDQGVKKRGMGMACLIHTTGFTLSTDTASAFIKLNEDGTANLLIGGPDIGQGSYTVMSQIVAEVIGIRLEDVSVTAADTDICPYDYGAYASKQTFIEGNAVKAAASDVKRQLLEAAAECLSVPFENLVAKDRKIFDKNNPETEMSISAAIGFAQFSKRIGKTILGKASYETTMTESPDVDSFYGRLAVTHPFAAQFAEVEVDTETGKVKVLRMVAAHDVGKAINPMAVEGQIEGSLQHGIGYALTEDLIVGKDGATLNPSFTDYKILTAVDMPKIDTIIVESIDPEGPYGAKGVGEPGLVPTAPAIANAIYNATGVRIKELPITPGKILKALKQKSCE